MTLFGGMPYDTNQISYLLLLSWLMLLVIGDCASGIPAARLLLRPQGFVLVRAGWKRWFRRVLLRCGICALLVCGILLLPALIRFPNWTTVLAWLLFTLHMEMIAAVQVLLIALFQSASAATAPILFTQLASAFLSLRLPGAWAILLPGNWGSLARTAEGEAPSLAVYLQRLYEWSLENEEASKTSFADFIAARLHGGFPLWAAVALNLAVILLIALFGWRPVRRRRRKLS